MNPVVVKDQAWLEGLRRGEEEAYRRLVTQYQRLVYSVAFRLCGQREWAEDLAQEVFVQVFRRVHQFRGESKFSVWLYRLAYHLGLNKLKGLRLERERLVAGVEMGDLEDIEDQSQDATTQDQKRWIEGLLARLPAHDRAILTLVYLEEMSLQEVAEVLELPEPTVRVRLFRARKRAQAVTGETILEEVTR